MFTLTKWMVAPLLAAGLMFAADTPAADAGGFSISIGNGGFGYSNYNSYRPSYGGHYNSYRPSYGARYGHVPSYQVPRYQSYRSNYGGHYDYHPTQVVPHGNHYDVYPGHYDYHRGPHYGHH
ncbi:hypothetical protein [Rubripirellula reticaptiva]|uniref:Uncharacterized protein n=1 Tax=Rubripirellula reticaptiva TaxID=2528013 RepID=A0A5C6EMF9_9BACT|nr:hypothetical protein [Rubripirellula reticaptiva]TWU49534.1 hypothetical protein Poly59_41510 [Rubripirellula reticaptiva]